jgi:Phosphomannomutase
MSEIIKELPNTYQSPPLAPFCKDEEKYQVVDELVTQVKEIKDNKTKVDGQEITEILTVNGVRFSFNDGSWGLIRASSNKPSLVIVTESPTSDLRKKKIFEFIDDLLQKTGKIGEYDQQHLNLFIFTALKALLPDQLYNLFHTVNDIRQPHQQSYHYPFL